MTLIRRLKGLRTLIVNFLMAIVPVLEVSGLVTILPPDWLPIYMIGMTAANIVLRLVTSTAVGVQAPPAEDPEWETGE